MQVVSIILAILCLFSCKQRASSQIASEQVAEFHAKRFPSPTRAGVEVNLVYSKSKQLLCRGLCSPNQPACESELQVASTTDLASNVGQGSTNELLAWLQNSGTGDTEKDLLLKVNKIFQDKYEHAGIRGTEVCRDAEGRLNPNSAEAMPSFSALITTNKELDAAKILTFLKAYPVVKSVDDFVSLIPEAEGVGLSMMEKSGSMCASAVDAKRPRALINSGDVVLAYHAPGQGECSDHIELIRINNREKFSVSGLRSGEKITGNPYSKQTYDFFLLRFSQQNPAHLIPGQDAGCHDCHLREKDKKMLPIWDIMPFNAATLGEWPGAIALSGAIARKFDFDGSFMEELEKTVSQSRRYRFLFPIEGLKEKMGPALFQLDRLFSPTGAIDTREFISKDPKPL